MTPKWKYLPSGKSKHIIAAKNSKKSLCGLSTANFNYIEWKDDLAELRERVKCRKCDRLVVKQETGVGNG